MMACNGYLSRPLRGERVDVGARPGSMPYNNPDCRNSQGISMSPLEWRIPRIARRVGGLRDSSSAECSFPAVPQIPSCNRSETGPQSDILTNSDYKSLYLRFPRKYEHRQIQHRGILLLWPSCLRRWISCGSGSRRSNRRSARPRFVCNQDSLYFLAASSLDQNPLNFPEGSLFFKWMAVHGIMLRLREGRSRNRR